MLMAMLASFLVTEIGPKGQTSSLWLSKFQSDEKSKSSKGWDDADKWPEQKHKTCLAAVPLSAFDWVLRPT